MTQITRLAFTLFIVASSLSAAAPAQPRVDSTKAFPGGVTPRPTPTLPRGIKEIAVCDDKLRLADWSVKTYPSNAPISVLEPVTDGNPTEHRSVQLATSQSGVLVVSHILTGDALDFTADGAIVELAGSYDLKGTIGPAAIETALVLEQNGEIYIGPRQPVTSAQWQNKRYSALMAKDFRTLAGKQPSIACGSPHMRVGFATIFPASLPASAANAKPSIAIDNWCLRVRTRCCPPLEAIAANPIDPNPRKRPLAATSRCCEEVARLDESGRPIPPPDADPNSEPEYSYVDEPVGAVSDLYPNIDTTIDLFYPKLECHGPIGDANLPEGTTPDLKKMLGGLGIDGDPVQISGSLEKFEAALAHHIANTEESSYPFHEAIAGPYIPQPPYVPQRAEAFSGGGGVDLIFVHGLKIGHLADKMLAPDGKAARHWQTATNFATDASSTNPEFYDGGYFKNVANKTWNGHIKQFLTDKGYFNRYLIVAYNCNDRMEVSALAILRQISDAMNFGTGVVNPSGSSTAGFGARGIVFVSHSAGGPVLDVAMTAAKKWPNLGVGYIVDRAKAVIAAHAVFSGSRLASAVLADLGPPTCQLARTALQYLDESSATLPPCPWPFSQLKSSILVDLVPTVTQQKWGSSIRDMPVRTLTVSSEHPTSLGSLKHLLHPGFDDGVATVNSQVANPNAVSKWPSGFEAQNRPSLFDIGVFGPTGTLPLVVVQLSSNALNNPLRALGFFIDQAVDPVSDPKAASGPIPYIAATGMLQSVKSLYPTAGLDTNPTTGIVQGHSSLQRSPNHFSYLFSTSDHFKGTHDRVNGFNIPFYENSMIEKNWEETRVITDAAVYAPYTVTGSSTAVPLLRPENVPKVVEIERGLRVRFRTIRKWRVVWGDWKWIWRRYYFVLEGSSDKMQFDYVYGHVLK